MRFMTPELYVKYNSSDDRVVAGAEEEWERALSRSQRHYKKIHGKLPKSVRRFLDEHCLHDADILGPALFAREQTTSGCPELVLVAQNVNTLYAEHLNTMMILYYVVTSEPVVDVPVPSDAFHPAQPIWLYDEFDVVGPGVFRHEILLSDGRVVKIDFRDFRMQMAPLVGVVRSSDLQRLLARGAVSA